MSNTVGEEAVSPFSSPEHHAAANHLGIWCFLATEILFFGGMFAAYSIYRWTDPAAFAEGSRHLEFWIGTINTAVLLTSSLFMVLADLAVKEGRTKALAIDLAATWLLGALFVALKLLEYHIAIDEGHVPGSYFHFDGPYASHVEIFMFFYFAMTGLHAVHMLFGLGALAWLLFLTRRGALGPARDQPVAVVALYWHFVDCVWVFLYPLLYLAR